MDPIREKFIQITPEEVVRQGFVQYLYDELCVPKNIIEIEVPLSYFKKGAKGRADIIVNYFDCNNNLVPVLIVECKAPNIPLTDKAFLQVVSYDEIICAGTVIITNGKEMIIQSWNEEKNEYCNLSIMPKYEDLVDRQQLKFGKIDYYQWNRPAFSQINSSEVLEEFLNNGWIGEDTSKVLAGFIINLCGLIQDDSKLLNSRTVTKVKVLEDCGIRYTTFGNAGGGNFTGDYRYFIVEDDKKNNQIISIAIMRLLKCQNDPMFGNRRGSTTLIAAIDDYEVSHCSLELNLDKYTLIQDNIYTIWHDGSLTLGNRGAIKRKEVIEYIREKCPELIYKDDKIFLGTFDNSIEFNWEQDNAIDFIGRLIKYALVRDEFRKYKSRLK